MPQQHCYFPKGNLEEVKEELYDVHKIHGSSYAFATIRADGQVGWRGLSAGDGDFGTLKKTSRKPDKLVVNHFSIFFKMSTSINAGNTWKRGCFRTRWHFMFGPVAMGPLQPHAASKIWISGSQTKIP